MSSTIPSDPETLLRDWFDREKASGLVDVKFFASTDIDYPSSQATRDVLAMLEDEARGHFEDITDQEI